MTLTKKEWLEMPSGTSAIRIKCFNDCGNLVGIDYVLNTGDDEMEDDIKDCKSVSNGYMTETISVTRK
jgi:hypothetical protein